MSKTFDVDAAPGARAHKKITYTNPYARPRTFHLRCTHPLLLHFRPDRLDLPAGGSRPMGLTFEPAEDWERATRGRRAGFGAGPRRFWSSSTTRTTRRRSASGYASTRIRDEAGDEFIVSHVAVMAVYKLHQ